MISWDINVGNIVTFAGFVLGGYKFAVTVRDELTNLKKTVYGSVEPPVDGLVQQVKLHGEILSLHGFNRRIGDHQQGPLV